MIRLLRLAAAAVAVSSFACSPKGSAPPCAVAGQSVCAPTGAAAFCTDLTSDIKWTHAIRRVPVRQKLDAIFVSCERPLQYWSWSLDLPSSDHIPVFAEILGWGD